MVCRPPRGCALVTSVSPGLEYTQKRARQQVFELLLQGSLICWLPRDFKSSLDSSGLSGSLFSSPRKGAACKLAWPEVRGLGQTYTALPAVPPKGNRPSHPSPQILPRSDISNPDSHPPPVLWDLFPPCCPNSCPEVRVWDMLLTPNSS